MGAHSGVKRCPKCGETKPLGEFSHRSDGSPQSWCKACVAARTRRDRRKTGMAYERSYRLAKRKAVNALIDAHLEEYEALLQRARHEVGLPRTREVAPDER